MFIHSTCESQLHYSPSLSYGLLAYCMPCLMLWSYVQWAMCVNGTCVVGKCKFCIYSVFMCALEHRVDWACYKIIFFYYYYHYYNNDDDDDDDDNNNNNTLSVDLILHIEHLRFIKFSKKAYLVYHINLAWPIWEIYIVLQQLLVWHTNYTNMRIYR